MITIGYQNDGASSFIVVLQGDDSLTDSTSDIGATLTLRKKRILKLIDIANEVIVIDCWIYREVAKVAKNNEADSVA